MKRSDFWPILYLIGTMTLDSCQKELSPVVNNKSPFAFAGPDQSITLPVDNITLDGTASRDPDGTISEWLWKKLSGPASYNISDVAVAKTMVNSLENGVYRFELMVKDDGGLSAKDTIQITVTNEIPGNKAPVANAGMDQAIFLPANHVILDGSNSIDTENNIIDFLWTKISGPSSFTIANVNVAQTHVGDLVEGIYLFELKVTDAGGLYSMDTIQINVNDVITAACEPVDRPVVYAQLVSFGNLSQARSGIAAVSGGNKLFFAGGHNASGVSARVDIYDISTQIWSTAELSMARTDVSAVTCGNKIFLAGGTSVAGLSTRVDIYDIASQTWSTAELSEPRTYIVSAATGNKVFFAGGCSKNDPYLWTSVSSKVDIYDLSKGSWSTFSLSENRIGFTATATGSRVYFAGGWNLNPDVDNSVSSTIDIYDDVTGAWSTSKLNQPRAFHSGISKDGQIYWGGGYSYVDEPWIGGNVVNCGVEIRNLISATSTYANLSRSNAWVNGSSAFENEQKIIFIHPIGGPLIPVYFDIYDITSNSWSIGVAEKQGVYYTSALTSSSNAIYIAGGITSNGSGGSLYTNQVWKLEF